MDLISQQLGRKRCQTYSPALLAKLLGPSLYFSIALLTERPVKKRISTHSYVDLSVYKT